MSGPLVLFGAGASYASQKHAPPMGDSLFEALRLWNPEGWGRLESDLASEFRGDFERGMSSLASTRSDFMPILQRAMAAYFFRFVPSRSSLYIKFAGRIKSANWKGAIATLNYERLIELSLLNVGIQAVIGSTHQEANSIEVCFPHGCCHIFCDSVRASASAVRFSGPEVKTSGEIRIIFDPGQFKQRIESDAFPPVMSYFEPEKRTSSGWNFIEAQRDRWQELCNEAPVIAIVGLKVRPHDRHIWDPIANAPGKIVYCSGITSAEEFEQWCTNIRSNELDNALHLYFKEAFDQICDEIGLSK